MNGFRSKPRPTKPRIIVLDDEKVLWDIMDFWIKQWFKEYELMTLDNGDDAWKELERAEPDFYMMDWDHPGMHGREIFSRLVEKRIRYPLVVNSGHESIGAHVLSFSSLGLRIGFLPKPFSKAQFWRMLNDFIGPSDFPEMQAKIVEPGWH
jgi:DNA-binding NtrC family response regulator